MNHLNILMVEDNEDDALLILNEIKSGGFVVDSFLQVQTAASMKTALYESTTLWNLIISDYNMPTFNGMQALELLKESGKDIPFILISGMIGEETAVAALKAGANDYLLKDKLFRLPKAIQKELDEAKQRLQLKETLEQLELARQSAVTANQHKSQVLAFVAHEFKNPLHAIALFADLLKDEVQGSLNEKQAFSIQNIQSATSHLKILVNDILDIAAIEAGKIKLNCNYFDIVTLINNIIDLLYEQAKQENIEIQADIVTVGSYLFIYGDENRLKQVFINLVSNALKYSRKNTIVTIRLFVKNNNLIVSVIDQGIGIAKTEIDKLFTEFYRIQNQFTSYKEGMGLGLALTKTLVEMHKGEILVESQQEVGSIFSVILPLI